MKSYWIVLPIAITTLISGCFEELDDGPVSHDDLEEDVMSSSFSLTKGQIGAMNGQDDYCNDPANKCVSGEGDCDKSIHCATGTFCAPDNGAKFGFPWNFDVCVPPHCNNKFSDPGLGETGVDCGGPCGTCQVNCATEPPAGTASKEFCATCLCGRGQGDCDADRQCQTGLVCADRDFVAKDWSYPAGWDVCLPAHCENGVRDAGKGETSPDLGGPCSPGPLVPELNVYFSEYVEGSGANHHLEIYNAGSAPQNCTVNVYYAGSTTAGSTHPLNAAIAPGGLFVLCRSSGGVGTPPCNQSYSNLQFVGRDAIELVCGASTQDIIGQIGFDPGAAGWGSGAQSTYNRTLRRKCTVTTGDKVGSDAFVPSAEWDGFALNTFNNLGVNSCLP